MSADSGRGKTETPPEVNGGNIQIKTPLQAWVKQISLHAAREAAGQVQAEFEKTRLQTCPVAAKVGNLDKKFYVLCAFLTGLGVLNMWSIFGG